VELARELKIEPEYRVEFRRALKSLEQDFKIVKLSGNRYAVASINLIRATISFNESGFGIAVASDGGEEFYIAQEAAGCALHRDVVDIEVLKSPSHLPSYKKQIQHQRKEGRVRRVVEHKTTEVIGLLRHTPHYSYVVPDNVRIPHEIRLTQKDGLPEEFHKVVVKLEPWDDPMSPLMGRYTEDIGHRDAPGVAMQCIIRSYGYEQTFPEAVMHEVESILKKHETIEVGTRRDLRADMIFTIDPESARDFDDAVSVTKHPGGGWTLGVHIADVAEYVTPDSAIDKEALKRGNSVYLVDRVIMMLPKELTAELCSLKPIQDSYAHSIEIQLNDLCEVIGYETYLSVIHSKARLSYNQVQQWFDGEEDHQIPDFVIEPLGILRDLAQKVRTKRFANGSVEVETPQVNCILGPDGNVVEIKRSTAKEAYALIEECMLLANTCVADLILKSQKPGVYRIHEEPDPEQWENMGTQLHSLGFDEAPTTRQDINRIMEGIPDGPMKFAATLSVLRNFKRALYAAESAPHFGLAFDNYTHFTSPIRRYADLLVHRILRSIEDNQRAPYKKRELITVTEHICQTELNADAAEKESVELKRVEYYNEQLYKGNIGPHEATVIKLLNKGMIVEMNDSLQRGLVPFAELHGDFYNINEERTRVTGDRHGGGWTLGDLVSVEIVKVDTARRLVDFRLVGLPERRSRNKGKGKGKGDRGYRGKGGKKKLPKGSVRSRRR
jgi:ribonuclease R